MSLTDSSDEHLLSLVSQGDISAEEELIRRYRRKVSICTRKFYLLGGDDEDLVQEGMIGLLGAIRTYVETKGASFNTYAERCIYSKLIDAVSLKKYVGYISIEDSDIGESAADFCNPESILIEEEQYSELISNLNKLLSQYERSVLRLFLEGRSYSDIANELSRPAQSVYNAVQRIRNKLSGMIN